MTRPHRTEEGSMLLTLLAVIAIGAMTAATMNLVGQSQRTTRNNRSYTAAIQTADAGIQQAYTYFTTNTPEALTVTSDDLEMDTATSAGNFSWTATRSGFDWLVRATGTVGDEERFLEARITRGAAFQLAAFGDMLVDLNGDSLIQSYNSASGSARTGNGTVGSNGAIVFNGNATSDAVFPYGGGSTFTGGGGLTATRIADRFDVEALHLALQAEADELCNGSTALDGAYEASTDGDLTPGGGSGVGGVYCFSEMLFDADMEAVGNDTNNPVIVYVLTDGIKRTNKSIMANCPICDPKETIDPAHQPGDFQINVLGAVDVGYAQQSEYGWTLIAPKAKCSKDGGGGGQTTLFGSMLCGSIDTKGGFDLYFDDNAINSRTGLYHIADYREELRSTTSF